jgi:signal transduction histidine kinase
VRFKYRLEGYNNNWTDAGTERKTSYSKIPPGKYTFRVIACNNEGVWNEEGDSLEIIIVPPFYMTGWFGVSMVLLGLLAVGLIVFLIIRRNKKLLLQKQKLQLQAIVTTEDSERQRIAKDLHDGVGQLLSSVKMNMTTAEGQSTDEKTVKIMRKSKEDIDRITSELRNISYNLMPSSLEKFGLATAMEEEVNKLEDSRTTAFHFNKSIEQERFDPKVEIMLYRLFQEMLGNALKHARATEITVQLLQHGRELQLMVEDDGQGFDLKTGLAKSNSSGLKNLYSRAALINGEIVIDSHPRSGTSIIIEVEIQPWLVNK